MNTDLKSRLLALVFATCAGLPATVFAQSGQVDGVDETMRDRISVSTGANSLDVVIYGTDLDDTVEVLCHPEKLELKLNSTTVDLAVDATTRVSVHAIGYDGADEMRCEGIDFDNEYIMQEVLLEGRDGADILTNMNIDLVTMVGGMDIDTLIGAEDALDVLAGDDIRETSAGIEVQLDRVVDIIIGGSDGNIYTQIATLGPNRFIGTVSVPTAIRPGLGSLVGKLSTPNWAWQIANPDDDDFATSDTLSLMGTLFVRKGEVDGWYLVESDTTDEDWQSDAPAP